MLKCKCGDPNCNGKVWFEKGPYGDLVLHSSLNEEGLVSVHLGENGVDDLLAEMFGTDKMGALANKIAAILKNTP